MKTSFFIYSLIAFDFDLNPPTSQRGQYYIKMYTFLTCNLYFHATDYVEFTCTRIILLTI